MTLFEHWVRTPLAHAIGWTLFHSLWEGAMVAVTLAAVLFVIRSSRVRYAVSCLAMLIIVVSFGLTFMRLAPQRRIQTAVADGLGTVTARHGLDQQEWFTPGASRNRLENILPWFVPFWTAGVLIFCLKHLAGWTAARRMARTGVYRSPDFWQEQFNALSARVGLSKPVRLLESCLAETPVIIGHIRPVILMPIGLLTGLPAGLIESILLHELAHIRRCDYLVNLLQTSIEALLFYHPAIWWMSGVIRAERENSCDDAVVAMNGDAHEYAVALAALEQNRCGSRELALSATGGSLVKRIRRLLRRPEPSHSAFPSLLPVGILTITAALALAAWQAEPARHVPTSTPPATRDVAVAPTAGARVKLLAQVQAAPARPPLMSPYAAWLDSDVVYIITHRERDAFRSLHTDEERQQFIEQFWLRRDPTPATPENEAKEEHYRRIAYSNARYATSEAPGWMTDRGRIYITSGPPDHIESHPGVREIWRYSNGREYEFAGESYALVRGVHQLKAIVVDRLPQPVQSQLRDRLAPFVDQPMSEALIQQIEQAASRIDRGLSYLWQDDPVSGHTVLELSYDNPATPSEPRPSFASTSYRVRLSAERMRSKLIHSVTPQYPRMPLNNESGPVTLEALVGVDGKVRDVYVISGKPSLAGAAERAVRQWIYQPTVLAGQPTEVVTTIEIQFPAPQ